MGAVRCETLVGVRRRKRTNGGYWFFRRAQTYRECGPRVRVKREKWSCEHRLHERAPTRKSQWRTLPYTQDRNLGRGKQGGVPRDHPKEKEPAWSLRKAIDYNLDEPDKKEIGTRGGQAAEYSSGPGRGTATVVWTTCLNLLAVGEDSWEKI